jgi:hypothetical protein
MILHSGLFDVSMGTFIKPIQPRGLSPKPVQGLPPALERIDDIVGSNGPAMRVLRVGDGVADDVGKEVLEHRAGLLVH